MSMAAKLGGFAVLLTKPGPAVTGDALRQHILTVQYIFSVILRCQCILLLYISLDQRYSFNNPPQREWERAKFPKKREEGFFWKNPQAVFWREFGGEV
jgi:hypothetical protein